MAKDAFSVADESGHKMLNTNELVAFTELLNKQFIIAGTSAQGMEATMTQLTQAMASGVLRGDELNSVFEQAPTIIETIANHLGVEMGQVRQLAQEGKITASVVKEAMLSSADEIDAKFNSMPYTYSQVATMIQNILFNAFEPAIQMIGSGAQWIVDNWDDIEPILVGIAGGIAIATVAWGAWTAAMWLADAANRATIAGMLANPFLWIAVALGLVITVTFITIESQNPPKVLSSKTYTWSDDKRKQAKTLVENGYSKQAATSIIGNTTLESDSNPTIFILIREDEPFAVTRSYDKVVNQIINHMTVTTFNTPIKQFDIENDTIQYNKSELELYRNQDYKFRYYSLVFTLNKDK